jgi:hypothetical protein
LITEGSWNPQTVLAGNSVHLHQHQGSGPSYVAHRVKHAIARAAVFRVLHLALDSI